MFKTGLSVISLRDVTVMKTLTAMRS